MTVIEVVKKYGLEDYGKTYKNTCGNKVPFPVLAELPDKLVKSVEINFPTKEVTITVIGII